MGEVKPEVKADVKPEVKNVEEPVVTKRENVPQAATDENIDNDYEDGTPLNSVEEEIVEKPRDSFVETKEEIVDNLEFIKAKLSTSPTAPVKAKRVSQEPKEEVVAEVKPEVKPQVKEIKEVKEVKEVITKIKEETVVKPKETTEVSKKESTETKTEEFSKECIPPVRPARSRKTQARLSVPEWTPPKQSILEYVFSCLKPKVEQ